MHRFTLVAGIVLSTAGCFHTVVETGLPSSSTVIDRPWAHSFLAGLVPPSTMETAQKCSSGVAKVETQMSFPNLVASALTGGVYSPMQLTVTCAQGRPASTRTIGAGQRSPYETVGHAANAVTARMEGVGK